MNKNNSQKQLVLNQANNEYKAKLINRSQSVIRKCYQNKTIKNYIEQRLSKKRMIQLNHTSTGLSSSSNSHFNPKDKGMKTPSISCSNLHKNSQKAHRIIQPLQNLTSSFPQLFKQNNHKPLISEINHLLIEQIIHLKQENERLNLENLEYKRLFFELENSKAKKDIGIYTLSSKSNKEGV